MVTTVGDGVWFRLSYIYRRRMRSWGAMCTHGLLSPVLPLKRNHFIHSFIQAREEMEEIIPCCVMCR
jgi:hypothetical protein